MRKRIVAVGLIAILAALAIVPAAFGAKGNKYAKGKCKFQLNGVVVSTETPGTIVVKVKSGTKTVKALRGQELSLIVSPSARMIDATVDPCAPATIEAFVVGAKVHIGGTIDRSDPVNNPVFTATKLILQKLPAPVVTP